MIGFIKDCKIFSVIAFLLFASCSTDKTQTNPQTHWSDRFIELRSSYQSKTTDRDIKELVEQFNKEYPWQGHAIGKTLEPGDIEQWFEGTDPNTFLEKLLQTSLSQIEPHTTIFYDKLTRLNRTSEEENLKNRLLLIDEILEFKKALSQFNAIRFVKVENAISDINSRFPGQYNSKKLLFALSNLKEEQKNIQVQLSNSCSSVSDQLAIFIKKYESFKKEALLSNPLVSSTPIVFVTRIQYKPDHHNTATLFQTDETNTQKFTPGGSMKVIDLKNGGKITTLLKTTDGVIRDPEVSYDAKKIVFSMRKNINEDYHIYEIDIDGKNLKQITAAKGVADIDPHYLPDGDIVFTSTREPKYCMCNIHIMGNLFRMEPDGANITQLGKSSLFEGHSTILSDGRILYDRWEYVDRNFGDAQGLWTMNPDGTNQSIYFGNNTSSPGGFIDARPIPETEKVIAILGSCHDRPWGALGIINREKGIDAKSAIEQTWPATARHLIGKGDWDTFKQVKPLYEDPFPLNDSYFLCSRTIGIGEQMGLFLIDTFGNEQLIYTEAPGCYDPIPIKSCARVFVIHDKRDYKSQTGNIYVQDVYQGTHMKGVKRGTVKYLRIIESVEKRSWTEPAWSGQGVQRPAMNWHNFECKKIWGTVPVETDGSVYVEVPADKYVFFQLLDENKMMIQSMRSGTMVHSGETLGCIGCHEDRRMAPITSQSQLPKALTRPPGKLTGWYGEPRNFGFMREVQPVLDMHCVTCHDFDKKAGKKLLLAADRNPYFNASYMDMWMKKVIAPIGAGPAEIQQAYSWGSHSSKLIRMIRNGHANIKLTTEEMERLITWIDMNAGYYPDFISAYPDNTVGRSPLSQEDIDRLGKLTNVDFKSLGGHQRTLGPQISFERPNLSPCLKNISDKDSAEYKEALSLITKGKKQLAQIPRLDMDGFVPSPIDQQRLNKYQFRQNEEMKNRAAIQEGNKHYDQELGRIQTTGKN